MKNTKKRIISFALSASIVGASLVQPICALAPSYKVGEQYKKSKYYERLTELEATGDERYDVIAVAISQLGYHEGNSEADMGGENSFGYRNFVEYNRIAGAPLDNGEGNGVSYGFEWCAAFVSWCERQAGVSKSTVVTEVSCSRMVDWLKERGIYRTKSGGYEPKLADLIFFRASSSSSRASHVGLVVGVDGDYIYTIEGNKGERVNYHRYKKSEPLIIGYGTPNYKTVSGTEYDFELKEGYIEPGVYVTTEDLNIRTGRGTQYTSLGKIPKGTELEITEAIGDWAKVSYNGKSGWSSIDYLKLKGSIKYTVTYFAEGASSLPPPSTKEHGVGIAVSGIIPERAGYEFLGWSSRVGDTEAEYRTGDTISENKSQTLYAVWRYVGYKISFYADDGSLIETKSYDLGDKIIAPTPPEKAGGLFYKYEFSGWSPELPGSVSGDASFTARYEKVAVFESEEKGEESLPGSTEREEHETLPDRDENPSPQVPSESSPRSSAAASMVAGIVSLIATALSAIFINRRS